MTFHTWELLFCYNRYLHSSSRVLTWLCYWYLLHDLLPTSRLTCPRPGRIISLPLIYTAIFQSVDHLQCFTHIILSHSNTHSHTDDRGCHAWWQTAHQEQFGVQTCNQGIELPTFGLVNDTLYLLSQGCPEWCLGSSPFSLQVNKNLLFFVLAGNQILSSKSISIHLNSQHDLKK